MSLVLGPIHYTMHRRILLQDEMSRRILELALKEGWMTDAEGRELDLNYPGTSAEPLETIIDESNIHGWLSSAVVRSESRLAAMFRAVKDASMRAGISLDDLLSRMFSEAHALGQSMKLKGADDVRSMYQALSMHMLDGMPCDRALEMESADEDRVVWNVASCPHAQYWTAEGLDPQWFYFLRTAYANGLLEDTPYHCKQLSDDRFCLCEKEK